MNFWIAAFVLGAGLVLLIQAVVRARRAYENDDICPECGQPATGYEAQVDDICGVYTCKICRVYWQSRFPIRRKY